MTFSDSLAIALARMAYHQVTHRYCSDVAAGVPLRLVGRPSRVHEVWHLMVMVEAECKGRGQS